MYKLICVSVFATFACVGHSAAARLDDVNYDESAVPTYTLPDPLQTQDGRKVIDAETWRTIRRPELLRLFEDNIYGRSPKPTANIRWEVTSIDSHALGDRATRKEVTVFLTGRRDGLKMYVLLYVPNRVSKPVPAFLALNFYGNHCVAADPSITLSKRWMRQTREMNIVDNRATEASRGCHAARWPLEMIVERGYALATAYYGDLEPDFKDGWKTGIRAALSPDGEHTVFKPNDWGAIGAWAWGLSRAMDYLERDSDIDAKQVAVTGHSRLGKTALWAGAQDERFALVISNDSGEGGAALARRRFGERTHHLARAVPYWFCRRYLDFDEHENDLPVDAHELIALIAPRPVYVASASQDLWADPHGEFLAAQAAGPVYRLFDLDGLGVEDMPPPDRSVGDAIGYHVRTGQHDVTAFDWTQYLDFADRHFKHKRR